VSFAAVTLCVASQRVFIVVVIVYFVIDSVRKLLDTPSYLDDHLVPQASCLVHLAFGRYMILVPEPDVLNKCS
jgi:hypothetical protein